MNCHFSAAIPRCNPTDDVIGDPLILYWSIALASSWFLLFRFNDNSCYQFTEHWFIFSTWLRTLISLSGWPLNWYVSFSSSFLSRFWWCSIHWGRFFHGRILLPACILKLPTHSGMSKVAWLTSYRESSLSFSSPISPRIFWWWPLTGPYIWPPIHQQCQPCKSTYIPQVTITYYCDVFSIYQGIL